MSDGSLGRVCVEIEPLGDVVVVRGRPVTSDDLELLHERDCHLYLQSRIERSYAVRPLVGALLGFDAADPTINTHRSTSFAPTGFCAL